MFVVIFIFVPSPIAFRIPFRNYVYEWIRSKWKGLIMTDVSSSYLTQTFGGILGIAFFSRACIIASRKNLEMGEPSMFLWFVRTAHRWIWSIPIGTNLVVRKPFVFPVVCPGGTEIAEILRMSFARPKSMEIRHAGTSNEIITSRFSTDIFFYLF